MKLTLITTTLFLTAGSVFAGGTHSGGHEDMMSIGATGKMHSVSRTVSVSMMETDEGNYIFKPGKMTFRAGETVRFKVKNIGEQVHEFVMDEFAKNVEHKALMEKFPEMEHDDPNAVRLEPGESAEIIWTFTNPGEFEFACLIPGHYEAGMHGPLTVNK